MMKDQEKRKHRRDHQEEDDSTASDATREHERQADALQSTVETEISPPHAKRIKSGLASSSPHRTSTTTASVLETTATPPHYEPPTSLLLELNQKLLTSIVECDYETYSQLCSDDMVCMEPESHHQVVVGKEFHKYYFDLFGSKKNSIDTNKTTPKTTHVTMSQPNIQWLGGTPRRHPMVAVLSYVKLTQTIRNDKPVTIPQSETRVWELCNGKWINVHFHKSPPLSYTS
jgi:calcium/calmodulin-dependent protein kinase (CaM kinase) II